MKIILLQDVKSLGKQGDMVTVNDGYARNYVIPKGLGIEATQRNQNDLKLKKQHEEKLAAQRLADAQELARRLESLKIEVPMRAGENGKAFGSVGSKEIAEQAKKQHGLELDRKKIVLDEPIRTFGMFEVPIRLHPQVTGRLYVLVKEA